MPTATVPPRGLILQTGRGAGALEPLRSPVTLVGPDEACDVRVPAQSVRAMHCLLTPSEDGVAVRAVAVEGVRVNGQPVTTAVLRDGDLLEVGPYRYRLCWPVPAGDDADRDAWRVQVAAVVAQQSAVEEWERHVRDRADTLAREEDELAAHLERQRRRWLELQDQLAAARAELRAERRRVAAEKEQATAERIRAGQLLDSVRVRRERLRRLVRRLRRRFRRERDRSEAELRREREFLIADKADWLRRREEDSAGREPFTRALVQIYQYQCELRRREQALANLGMWDSASQDASGRGTEWQRERAEWESLRRAAEADWLARLADLDRRERDLDGRERILDARESAWADLYRDWGRRRSQELDTLARARRELDSALEKCRDLDARSRQLEQRRDELTARSLALEQYRRRYCDDGVPAIVFDRRVARLQAQWRRKLKAEASIGSREVVPSAAIDGENLRPWPQEPPRPIVVRADEIERSTWRQRAESYEQQLRDLRSLVEQLAALLIDAVPSSRAA